MVFLAGIQRNWERMVGFGSGQQNFAKASPYYLPQPSKIGLISAPCTFSAMAPFTNGADPDELRISLFYRLFFLYVEPLSAILGAYFSFFDQPTYLSLTHLPSAPQDPIPISTQIVLSQLSNLYLLFAINEALVLRSTKDVRVWKTVLFGLLVADFGHLWSVQILGWEVYWRVAGWNAIDWGNIGFVYAGALVRSCFLLGLGVKRPKTTRSEEADKELFEEQKPKKMTSTLLAGLNISLTGFEDSTPTLSIPYPSD